MAPEVKRVVVFFTTLEDEKPEEPLLPSGAEIQVVAGKEGEAKTKKPGETSGP